MQICQQISINYDPILMIQNGNLNDFFLIFCLWNYYPVILRISGYIFLGSKRLITEIQSSKQVLIGQKQTKGTSRVRQGTGPRPKGSHRLALLTNCSIKLAGQTTSEIVKLRPEGCPVQLMFAVWWDLLPDYSHSTHSSSAYTHTVGRKLVSHPILCGSLRFYPP